jgi:hypothetical protein
MTDKSALNDKNEYLSTVLNLYLNISETPSKASVNDRKAATELHMRRIPLDIVESAFLLASVRRLSRSPDMPPLSPIRSLAYFFPVIQELVADPLPGNYLDYLRGRAARLRC